MLLQRMMNNSLKDMTIGEVRKLDSSSRYKWVKCRKEWLKRQRDEDKKNAARVRVKINSLRSVYSCNGSLTRVQVWSCGLHRVVYTHRISKYGVVEKFYCY